jgi:hypothetical protein
MRTLAIALTLAAILPSAAPAEEPPVVEVEVGAEKALGPGTAPICDDPQVAWISADGSGLLHAVEVGSTVCSLMTGGGARRVFQIEVIPVKQKGRPAKVPGGSTDD